MTYNRYRVIFLGPTGGGKTSAIQTLLRVAQSQSSNVNLEEPTTTHQIYRETILGKEMVLLDTPGLANPSDNKADITPVLSGAFHDISPGPHIIVIVFSVKTTADIIRQTCLRYQQQLGHDVLKYTTIVFTGIDTLELSGTNFQGFIDALPSHIKQLIGTQLVALNNTSNAPLINVLQVRELMTKFDHIMTKNFGIPFNAKRFASSAVGGGDIATDVRTIFEKNSEVLERKLLLDGSETDGVTVAIIEQPHEDHIRKSASDDANKSSLGQQNGQHTNTVEPCEDVQLQPLQPINNNETMSRVSDDASMITSSSSQDKDGQTCGCFTIITRRFKSSESEPGFTQFK